MLDDNVKIQKMVEIAKMYYEENLTQNDIAKRLGVSRPLVSKMLADAREAGIVTIQIKSPFVSNEFLMEEIKKIYNIDGGMVIPQSDTDYLTDQVILNNIISYINNDLKKYKKFGLGWGKIISDLVQKLEISEKKIELEGYVCPLVGNISMPTKDFHSNELIRMFSQMTFLKPYYLFAPAFLATEQEKNLFMNIENYKDIKRLWEKLDVAILSIGNPPSVPDLATASRFGNNLQKEKAIGNILSYYYDINGKFITGDNDFSIEIPLTDLRKVEHVIGICSSKTSREAIIGALKTKIITHLIIDEATAKEII